MKSVDLLEHPENYHSDELYDFAMDRIIMLQEFDRNWSASESNAFEKICDDMIGLFTELVRRNKYTYTYEDESMSEKVRQREYHTDLGVRVVEKEYESGNMSVTLSCQGNNKKKEKKNGK